MFKKLSVLIAALTLTACAGVPNPPSCDGSDKRPINRPSTAQAAEQGSHDAT